MQVLHGMRTDDPSYLLRIDKKTGRTVWRVERPTRRASRNPRTRTRRPRSSSTATTTEIVITGGDVVTGHDPATGKELWRVHGLNPDNRGDYRIVASPLVAGGLVIAPTRESPMLAVRPGGRGDVTASHVAWAFTRGGPDVPTPVSDGQYVYVVNDRGVVHCLDVKTGDDRLWAAAAEVRHLQRVARARRRPDLRHERGWADVGVCGGADIQAGGRERGGRIHAELDCRLERPDLPSGGQASLCVGKEIEIESAHELPALSFQL